MTRLMGSLDTRMTFTASGNVTNIAARLADYAQKGEIIISEETKKLIQDILPSSDKGEVQLKGLSDPVHVYSLNN